MDKLLSELDGGPQFRPSAELQKYHHYKSPQLGYMHRMRLYLFKEIVADLIQKKVLVNFEAAIDVGCNTGIYSKIISDFGFKKTLGIDIEPNYVEKAQAKFAFTDGGRSLNYKVLNAEEIDTTEKYDFILCTEVIEHTGDQHKTIDNLNKILRKGGVAIITLPNVISLPYLLTWLSYKVQGRPFNQEMKDHLNYPFYKSIRLFKNNPYKLIKTSGTNLFYWHFLHKFPAFNFINKLNYQLGKIWPLKFFTQYFYVVLKHE